MERVVDFASSTISCDTAAAVSSPSPSPLIRSKRRLARMCGAVFLRSATVAVVVSRFGCCGISAPRFVSVILRVFISGTTRDLKNPPDACMSVTSVGQACVANIASSVVVVVVLVVVSNAVGSPMISPIEESNAVPFIIVVVVICCAYTPLLLLTRASTSAIGTVIAVAIVVSCCCGFVE